MERSGFRVKILPVETKQEQDPELNLHFILRMEQYFCNLGSNRSWEFNIFAKTGSGAKAGVKFLE